MCARLGYHSASAPTALTTTNARMAAPIYFHRLSVYPMNVIEPRKKYGIYSCTFVPHAPLKPSSAARITMPQGT